MNLRITKTISFEDMMKFDIYCFRILFHIDYVKLKNPKEGDMIVKISYNQFMEFYPRKLSFYKSIKYLESLDIIKKVGPSKYKINKAIFY